jgi:hypothetical protein
MNSEGSEGSALTRTAPNWLRLRSRTRTAASHRRTRPSRASRTAAPRLGSSPVRCPRAARTRAAPAGLAADTAQIGLQPVAEPTVGIRVAGQGREGRFGGAVGEQQLEAPPVEQTSVGPHEFRCLGDVDHARTVPPNLATVLNVSDIRVGRASPRRREVSDAPLRRDASMLTQRSRLPPRTSGKSAASASAHACFPARVR